MSKLKHIYLVRHGRSRANETGIREGGDSPLSKEGEKQAQFVAERFRNIPIEVVLSSHYVRAQDTGKIIASENNIPFEIIENTFERELPDVVLGKHRDDQIVSDSIIKQGENWINGVKEEGQESYEDVLERAKNLTKILEDREEEHIVVVSHGFFSKLFIASHIMGGYLTAENFINAIQPSMRSANTGITYFTIDENNNWKLLAWNDHAHLGGFNSKQWF